MKYSRGRRSTSTLSTDDLIAYIFKGRTDTFASEFESWLNASDRFKLFADKYKGKIRKKVRDASKDQDAEHLYDVRFELEIGFLLTKNPDFSALDYEKYVNGPDYTVTHQAAMVLNVEVKRIRSSQLQQRFEKWERRIGEHISAIPSELGAALDIYGPVPADWATFMDRLESKEPDILNSVTSIFATANSDLEVEEIADYPIAGFEQEIKLRLEKPSQKLDPTHTSYYHGSHPIFFTQDEFKQFRNAICDKLSQMRRNMVNVLVITTASDTHHKYDLKEAIEQLRARVTKHDEGFFQGRGFEGVTDFLEQSRRLSGILFRQSWGQTPSDRNALWRNPDAYCAISDDVSTSLRNLA